MTNLMLCGGSGTRLWPLSRTLMPKQFLRLFDGQSLLQQTLLRNQDLCDDLLMVAGDKHYFIALDQASQVLQDTPLFLLEPTGRNTAPAIALGCLGLDPNEMVLVTPCDHLIKDTHAYQDAVQKASNLAQDGTLVTFGVTPTRPDTGFGYIQASDHKVLRFCEKPNTADAQKYLQAGNFYWNSGMFCFKAGAFLDELKRHHPSIHEACVVAYSNSSTQDGHRKIQDQDMLNIPSDSIDYAVMEKSDHVKVVPTSMGWSDVGSFDALDEELPKDDTGNAILGSNHQVHIHDSQNNAILTAKRHIALIGVKDLIIADTDDALLIAQKGQSQSVKTLLGRISTQQIKDTHPTAYRPWGSYTVLEDTAGYKIKRIEVKPGKRLSLQKHFHRNEHWIVVSGTATVTVGETVKLVRPNESTYIRMGEVHRLENQGKIPVVLIEAQVGEYTGEDDIVRLEDDFGKRQ